MDMEAAKELLEHSVDFLTMKDYLERTGRDLVRNSLSEKLFIRWESDIKKALVLKGRNKAVCGWISHARNNENVAKSCLINSLSSDVVRTPIMSPAVANSIACAKYPENYESPSEVTVVEREEAPLGTINLSNCGSFMRCSKVSLSDYTAKENCLDFNGQLMKFYEVLINPRVSKAKKHKVAYHLFHKYKGQSKKVLALALKNIQGESSLKIEIKHLLSLMKGVVQGKSEAGRREAGKCSLMTHSNVKQIKKSMRSPLAVKKSSEI
eukprot:TRINITY_DN10315_c0_g1_i2.p1 TRINITY_DN10315_c0_g1~~TRINITY_DN10315_c0_g1_i2.p1  ORF type:complete len:266 (-),score=47.20 TRINITY_DN10315_c0_g1_i2:1330-2127(-)